ncbi:hypothetical protein [Nocardioides daphniae]|uniref:Uncharacterized protein n=1 Tax=Nocardioides daphniae TaxID=402297 RepID=A0A4V1CW67_9ACTN|nr:hypothetical protein [Nocardioides daphniae]QCC76207.1 hypothetical protein E2C04_01505 [Nocardioides daphniae]GGD08994.1 hypothetical protein GCM10007231_04840 [Nocardioides daphniae]
MNDLNAIRRALDTHSHALGSTIDGVTRSRQVHDRIDSSRRRRNRVRSGLALAAVAAVAAVVVPQLGGDGPDAADRTVLGMQAPSTVETPAYSYRFAEGFEGNTKRLLRVEIEASDTPRILTWATATDDQDVQVRVPESTAWDSSRDDFADWVEIAPGTEGTVEIASNTGAVGLGAALYEADPSALEDVVTGFHGEYFRAGTPTAERIGAAVGDPGQLDLRIPFDGSHRRISVEFSCKGLPAGAVIHAGWDGSGSMADAGDACQDGEGRGQDDLGLTLNWMSHDTATFKGEARVWVARSEDDETPLDPADHPDARLAGAVYTPTVDVVPVPGADITLDRTYLHDSHLWQLKEVYPSTADGRVISSIAQDGPALAVVSTTARGKKQTVATVVLADGRQIGDGSKFGLWDGGTGTEYAVLPRGTGRLETQAKVEGKGPAPTQHVGVYRLLD